MPEESPTAFAFGVGMPAFLYLHQFAELVFDAFGAYPYLVGSAVGYSKEPGRPPARDIDVRLVLGDQAYVQHVGPHPDLGNCRSRWASLALAYSALGKAVTGLPIDFQIQSTAVANRYEGEPRILLDRTRIP